MTQHKETVSAVFGKNHPKVGMAPAIALVNPKYPHNVGAALRAANCFGLKQVWYSGDRVPLTSNGKYRVPREERMRDYKVVELRQCNYFFDEFGPEVVPVAIEVRDNSELLPLFEHPEHALYVFGPEDGSLQGVHARHCHRFVTIPMRHCSNLSAAVYMVLYDRMLKRVRAGLEDWPDISRTERRGFVDQDHAADLENLVF